jgi:hypothetical protein
LGQVNPASTLTRCTRHPNRWPRKNLYEKNRSPAVRQACCLAQCSGDEYVDDKGVPYYI